MKLILLSIFFCINTLAQDIVSLSPGITQIFKTLGIEDKLIGVTPYCDADKKILRVGTQFSPNLKRILKISPKKIYVEQSQQSLKELEKIKINTQELKLKNKDQLIRSIKIIGDQYSLREKKDKLIHQIKNELKIIKPSAKTAVISFGHTIKDGKISQLFLSPRDTLHGNILDSLGLNNPVQARSTIHNYDLRFFANKNIDFIIVLSQGKNIEKYFQRTPFLNKSKIIVLNQNYFNINGPRILDLKKESIVKPSIFRGRGP